MKDFAPSLFVLDEVEWQRWESQALISDIIRIITASALQLPIKLEELRGILKKHGVISASVFGSFARGEARSDSDLDLLVKLEPGRSLFDLGGLQFELEETTKHGVDIATKLHPRFEPYITPDLVEIL